MAMIVAIYTLYPGVTYNLGFTVIVYGLSISSEFGCSQIWSINVDTKNVQLATFKWLPKEWDKITPKLKVGFSNIKNMDTLLQELYSSMIQSYNQWFRKLTMNDIVTSHDIWS